MRVVFDTNIYISAFAIPGGNAEEAYLKAIHGEFELFTSVAILTETARVLQLKFDWAEDRARDAIQEISQTATVLRPRPTLHVLKDEPDNRILECAMAAQADWIVSGDRHILALKRHAGSAIISPLSCRTRDVDIFLLNNSRHMSDTSIHQHSPQWCRC